jgi:hypothetical protein
MPQGNHKPGPFDGGFGDDRGYDPNDLIGRNFSHWHHHHGRPDTTPPIVHVDRVTSNNIVSSWENEHGFKVTGSAIGAEGRQIVVEIVDPDTDTIIATETAFVHHGQWKVRFDDVGFNYGDNYSVHASVTDRAGNEGTDDQTFGTVCFMAGTMIRTPDGEVAVETLQRGDLVMTSDGRAVPVTWLGRQTVSTVFADPLRVLPIRIRAGALGENIPARDLLVSPDHALFVGGVLVHASALVNGGSIVRETAVPQTFVYYHVEVDDHSLIFAEGVAVETFIDNVVRLAFDNWDEHQALYPDGKAIVELPYPRAKAYRQVPREVREMLAARSAALSGVASAA